MPKIKILLADDHQIVLDGLQSLLEKEAQFEIVAAVRDGSAVLDTMEKQSIDVAVLDIRMPQPDGIELAKIFRKQYPQTKIILLTMIGEGKYIFNALKLGVKGYILKEKSKEALIQAIYAVHQGHTFLPPDLFAGLPDDVGPEEEEEEVKLTKRQIEILCLLAKSPNLTNKELGEKLYIAEYTAQTHIQNLREKLNFSTKSELVKYAVEKGLCKD